MQEKNKKISYVILHYQVIEDTIECVESIMNLSSVGIQLKIIIVDNCSPNGSGAILKIKYSGSKSIHVILSEENIGFAKGNNLGCKFAIENFEPDYLIVLNNDIVIKQKNFQEEVIEIDKMYNFHVLGPNIISLFDGLSQNPVNYAITTKRKILKELVLINFLFLISFVYLDRKFMTLWNEGKRKKDGLLKEKEYSDFKENIKLHGSAIVFSKSYFNIYHEVFFNKTFMFIEEDILFKRIQSNSMKVIYSNKVSVYHKEDSATNSVFKKEMNKRRFIYRNTSKSLFEYLKAYDNL